MNLITFGTSHGRAEPGRACTGMLLTVGDAYYLIDCGSPTAERMIDRGLPIPSIRAAFITHAHRDHMGCLSTVISLFFSTQKRVDEKKRLSVWFPQADLIAPMTALMTAEHDERALRLCDFGTVEPGAFYEDENIRVEAIPTEHLRPFPSYAFVITAEGKRMLFSGDLTEDFHDFPAISRETDFDAIVCELTHFTPESALDKIRQCRTKQLIFNHVRQDRLALIAPLKNAFPFPVEIASDGDTFFI